MDDIKYKQFSDEFVPYLSIIDVLMHNGGRRRKMLIQQKGAKWSAAPKIRNQMLTSIRNRPIIIFLTAIPPCFMIYST